MNRNRKASLAALVLCAALTLTGCGEAAADSGGSDAGETSSAQSGSQAASSLLAEGTPQISPLSEENRPARELYAAALTKLLNEGILPDGTALSDGYIGSVSEREQMAENQFTVYDVDGDGREELVLLYTTAAVAGMAGFVYDCDTESGTLREQLSEFPSLTFYENGAVRADWSHNQGKSNGDFWPYNLYLYDAGEDSYTLASSVDAWGKTSHPEDYPENIDTSGAGQVYYLYQDLSSEWDKIDPVDESEYQAWLHSRLDGAQETEAPYESLTAKSN